MRVNKSALFLEFRVHVLQRFRTFVIRQRGDSCTCPAMATAHRNPSQPSTNEERDVRVEDYLNDKLQTTADLENLDALLDTVLQQQNLLKQQVSLYVRYHEHC